MWVIRVAQAELQIAKANSPRPRRIIGTAAVEAGKAADLSLTLYRDRASSYLVTAQSAALDAERLAIILHMRQQPSSA
jgi:hypothetical protein